MTQSPGKAIGYRSWLTNGERLESSYIFDTWEPGPQRATCKQDRVQLPYQIIQVYPDPEMVDGIVQPVTFQMVPIPPKPNTHAAPSVDCTCGLWMLPSLKMVKDRFLNVGDSVIGVVQAWGTVIEHTHGSRCEYMQVLALLGMPLPEQQTLNSVVPSRSSVLKHLGQVYDVPVIMTQKGLVEFAESYQ